MPHWKSLIINSLEFGLRILRLILAQPAGFLVRAYRLAGLRMACKGTIPASTQFDGPVNLIGTGRLTLGEYCRIGREVLFETEGSGEIVIGSHVRINSGCTIVAHSRVTIGDDTLIGEYVGIRDSNHGIKHGSLIRLQPGSSSEIAIGRDVWIGRTACVLKGVVLGDGAVVGANSVVTKDVPQNSVVAGVPAEVIGHRGASRESIN